MKCHSCHHNIPAGVAAKKMIVDYLQVDGTVKTFGYMMSDGKLSEATGRILRGYHHKCWWVRKKRDARGDAVTGRVMGAAVPTGYSIQDALDGDAHTAMAAHVEHLRVIARQVGKPVGDPTVAEAYWADVRGGPYPHGHEFKLDTYHLRAHLAHAHGYPRVDDLPAGMTLQSLHEEFHARAALSATTEVRTDDPGHVDPTTTDWRPQVAVDI